MKKLLATALVLTMGLSVSAGVLDKVDNALNKADTAVTNSLNKATAKKPLFLKIVTNIFLFTENIF